MLTTGLLGESKRWGKWKSAEDCKKRGVHEGRHEGVQLCPPTQGAVHGSRSKPPRGGFQLPMETNWHSWHTPHLQGMPFQTLGWFLDSHSGSFHE